MRLYDLASGLQEVIEGGLIFDEETGEILFDESNLDDLQCSLNEKLEASGIVIKNMTAERDAIRAEKLRLFERETMLNKRIDRLKDYVLKCMLLSDTLKVNTARVALSTRKSQRVEIEESAKLPGEYLNEKITYTPNKAEIRSALKEGKQIEGCTLVDNFSLQVG